MKSDSASLLYPDFSLFIGIENLYGSPMGMTHGRAGFYSAHSYFYLLSLEKIGLIKMKRLGKGHISWIVVGMFLFVTFLFRWIPGWGEWYAKACYPVISGILSSFSSQLPFSLGDCFIVAGCGWIVGSLIYALCKRKKASRILLRTLQFGLWVYVWFYFAWGINYFRAPFYERTEIERIAYSPEIFQGFLDRYVEKTNEAYVSAGDSVADWFLKPAFRLRLIDSLKVEENVGKAYQPLVPRFGLVPFGKRLEAKPMLWSGGMSKVGVTGYMGPFFSEFNINRDMLGVEYPFTYAHELAHRLGIASEAEANLYAYLACTGTDVPEIRFSGYFSLFGYVMGNARRLLSEQEYEVLYKKVRPEIIGLYKKHLNYWREKYSTEVGELQNRIYNFYLKSNQVSDGTKNYSEVVGLLISLEESGSFSLSD